MRNTPLATIGGLTLLAGCYDAGKDNSLDTRDAAVLDAAIKRPAPLTPEQVVEQVLPITSRLLTVTTTISDQNKPPFALGPDDYEGQRVRHEYVAQLEIGKKKTDVEEPEPECRAYEPVENEEPFDIYIQPDIRFHPNLWNSPDVEITVDYLKDPDLAALAEEFRKAAKRQIRRVKKAGGFCKIPVSKDFDPERFGRFWGDERLGDELFQIVQKRSKIIQERYPDLYKYGQPLWSASLGRSMCDKEKFPITLDPDQAQDDRKRRQVEAILDRMRRQFNKVCAASDGGILGDKTLERDPLFVRRLIAERGRLIFSVLSPDDRISAMAEWRSRCTPEKKFSEKPVFSKEEINDLYGSHLLADQLITGEYAAHTWTCEAGFNDIQADYCGRLTRCVGIRGEKPRKDEWSDETWVPGKNRRVTIAPRGIGPAHRTQQR